MEHVKLSRYFTAGLLLLSFAVPVQAQQASYSQKLALSIANNSEKDSLILKKQMLEYAVSVLRIPPTQVLSDRQILATDILDLSEKNTTAEEKKILYMWADMIEKKTLRKNIELMIEEIKKTPSPISEKIKSTPQIYINYAIDTLTASIEAVAKMRGLTSDSSANTYLEWTDLSEKMTNRLNQDQSDNILAFANSQLVLTERAEILVDGEASFSKRELLIKQAKKSINILTWSVYDDMTGAELADLLIEKKKENKNLKIRLIVDGQVARQAGRNVQLNRIKNEGIEVMSWFSASNPYMGQHRKMLIVDGEHLIAGGLNYGDVYSHKNPDLKIARWRDTDVYLKGAGAIQGLNVFTKLWNDQLKENKNINYTKMISQKITNTTQKGIEVVVIEHDPKNSAAGSTIMMTILKTIRAAKESIDIQNAYIILFPALKNEIENAIKRNVKVRILTNSAQSVDEPIVSIPILRSVIEFVKMGAEVFVKKGATLHSKLLIVDSQISMVMSYNLHPRSERIEGEMAVLVKNQSFSTDLKRVFDKDISEENAQAINKTEDLILPNSPVALPTLRLFFDML